jgi:hypothetical protein
MEQDPMPDLATAAPEPCLYVSGPTHRFVDCRGREWNLFDCMELSGRLMLIRVGSPAAEYRMFVATNSELRLYTFDFSESRSPYTLAVERQLRESGPYTRE